MYRINQFLAKSLGISRREADNYVERGLIEVNGSLAGFSDRVGDEDVIKIYENDNWRNLNQTKVIEQTVLFYKPIFSITSNYDPQGRKTIYNYLPTKYHQLKSAGRLDYMTEGLLILSNNGNLIQDLTHPKNEHQKMYLVGLKEKLSKEAFTSFEKGFVLEDKKLNPVKVTELKSEASTVSSKKDPAKTNKPAPTVLKHAVITGKNLGDQAEYFYLNLQPNFFWYKFTLTEGRNNQIRKMVESFESKVLRLIRVQQGDYKLTKELFEEKMIEVKN